MGSDDRHDGNDSRIVCQHCPKDLGCNDFAGENQIRNPKRTHPKLNQEDVQTITIVNCSAVTGKVEKYRYRFSLTVELPVMPMKMKQTIVVFHM